MNHEQVVISPSTTVVFASNVFIDVPTILQFEQTKLLWLDRGASLELDAAVNVHHADGTLLGVVRNGRFFGTKDGEKANVKTRHGADMYALELNGQTLLEVRKPAPRVIHPTVELYTPTGFLVRGSPSARLAGVGSATSAGLVLPNVSVSKSTFEGCSVGIWFDRRGGFAIGGAAGGIELSCARAIEIGALTDLDVL